MARKFAMVIGVVVSALSAHAQTTMTAGMFTFNFSLDSAGFFTSTGSNTARNTLSLAGTFVTSIITGTTVNAISASGSDSWTPSYLNPNTLASVTGTTNQTISSNTFLIYAGGATNSTLGGGLGTALASTTQGGYSASTSGGAASTTWSNALQYRGNGTNNVPWGGTMSFNSNTVSWYYDNDTSFTSGEIGSSYDFFSVAVHELFHLIGFGATSGAYSATWNGKVSGTNFTGLNASGVYGGNVPLASSSDKAHWQEATGPFNSITGGSQTEAMMDPTLGTGIRKYPTTLDTAALRDIGYTTNAIPEPAQSAVIGGLAALGLCFLWRRRAA